MKRKSLLPIHFVLLFVTFLLCCATSVHADGDDTDYDDDGQDDYVVYRRAPLEGFWFILSPRTGQQLQFQWGLAGDIPVPGQYTDNLRPDLAVYRPSTGFWFIREWDESLQFSQMRSIQWGGFAGDIPVPCDYNADSFQDIAVYRNGVWFILFSTSFSTSNTRVIAFGNATDQPVPRDYDGDNRCDLAVWRPSAASYFVLLSSTDFEEGGTIPLGVSTDIPISGFFDSDDKVDFAVYRPGNPSLWIYQESRTQRIITKTIPWGLAGDAPIATDIDGDGQSDIVVWRPSEGNWYLLKSSDDFGSAVFQPWGLPSSAGTDVPLGQYRAPASFR